eukprot:1051082-Pleurochrysis_carterae.AAC.1
MLSNNVYTLAAASRRPRAGAGARRSGSGGRCSSLHQSPHLRAATIAQPREPGVRLSRHLPSRALRTLMQSLEYECARATVSICRCVRRFEGVRHAACRSALARTKGGQSRCTDGPEWSQRCATVLDEARKCAEKREGARDCASTGGDECACVH